MMLTHSHGYSRAWCCYAWRSKLNCILPILLVCLLYLSCSKKQAVFQPTDPLGIANKWVYDSMKLYYYWADQMTDHPDYSLPTQAFFKQLLSPEDRFSWISNHTDVSSPQYTFQLFGFHYTLIRHPFNPQQLVGVITLVVPASDAASRVHLKRGMFFTQVNNKHITDQNMNAITGELESKASSNALLQLAALNANGTALIDSVQVTVNQKIVASRAVYTTRFFNKNGIKTGYLPYFLCAENEDNVLLQKLQALKNERITELILDLRYNPGGSVASVSKLAAALVPSFNADNIFITYKGNRNGGTVKLTFKEAVLFSGYSIGKDMNYLQTLNLGLKRIYILTSGVTASAAELLTNNLKPYTQVNLIGDKTLGKDEASFTIEDKGTPKQVDWILTPIVYKVADVNGHGNYSSGMIPDYVVNEFSSLPLQELGMPGDLPVDKALELIYGTSQVDVIALRRQTFEFPDIKPLFHSSGAFPVTAPK